MAVNLVALVPCLPLALDVAKMPVVIGIYLGAVRSATCPATTG
jgi:hypothetical protein